MTNRTEEQCEIESDAIATAIWEQSTGNGRDLDREMWGEHRTNCEAAVANTYRDGIDSDEWQSEALARVSGDALEVWTVEADPETGEWAGEPQPTGRRVSAQAWARLDDTDEMHRDTYVYDHETQSERAIEVHWTAEAGT